MRLAVLALAVALQGPPPRPETPSVSPAPVQTLVLTGDRLVLRGQILRLGGIAAPSPAQRCDTGRGFVACGEAAARLLRELIRTGKVACQVLGPQHSPWMTAKPTWIGTCAVDGRDLAGALVENGYAVPAPGAGLQAAGLEACVARRGIWAWSLEHPWTFAARQEGVDVTPVFIGERSGTPCLRALQAGRSLIPR